MTETLSPPPSPPIPEKETPSTQPRRKRRVRLVVVSIFAALAILVLAQSWVVRAELAVALAIGVLLYRSPLRGLLPIAVALLGVVGLLFAIGSYNWVLDVIALVVAAAIVAVLAEVWVRVRPRLRLGPARRWPIGGEASVAIAFGFLFVSWLTLTGVDMFTIRRAARKEWNTGRASCPEGLKAPNWGGGREPRVAVAVSGGGYRAALFHAGMFAGLECIRVPVTGLSTVSGGSIIGAYYAVGGEPQAFRAMATEGLFNLKRELLHTGNFSRFLRSLFADLFGRGRPDNRFTQTDVQASLLDRLLYRGLRMSDLDSVGGPRLLVNVTDLVTSERMAIGARGVLQPTSHDPVSRQQYANSNGLVGGFAEFTTFREATPDRWPANEPLSKIVSASGAFPGAMRPVAVFVPNEPLDTTTTGGWYILADGGIADNTGLASVRDAMSLARDWAVYQRCASRYGSESASVVEDRCGERPWGLSKTLEPWLIDVAVMSDGSAMSKASTPTTTLAELGRTADVMYRMSGPQRPGSDDTTASQLPVLLVSPRTFQSAADDSVYWSTPLEASAARDANRAYRSLHLWSFDLDVGTIRFMIEYMPED
jgi:predicted acylesterase/phospholipase RssA